MFFTEIEKDFKFSIFDITLGMNNIKVEEATYNPETTKLTIHGEKPNFEINLVNCNFAVGFNYSVRTKPVLVNDTGYAKGWLKDLNITVKASPSVSNLSRFFQFEF